MPDPAESIAYCHACGAAMDVTAMAPFTRVECPHCGKHTRIKCEFGPYTLLRRHAVGGMSMVFAASDNTLGREVAIKILSEEYSANEQRIAAFEEEARLTASLSHPHIVRVLRSGRAFDRFYIAMEMVPGGHFEEQINQRGAVPERELLPIAIEVAHGLKAAYNAGLIHRDVKPGNILLDADGHAKLVDFGLALVTHGGKAQASELWATPYYVPPETIDGQVEDFRSDIYAFGATLYHALAGQPPCGEESMATAILREAKKHITPLDQVTSEVSPATCRIVEQAMAYHPNDRFASYDALIASLQNALTQLKAGSAPTTPESHHRHRRRTRQKSLMIAGAAGLLVTLGGLGIARLIRPSAAPTPVAAPGSASTPAPAPSTPERPTQHPAAVDSQAAIVRDYLDARAAIAAHRYEQAAVAFAKLYANPAVEEPSRSRAGVEAALAYLLHGQTKKSREQIVALVKHLEGQASTTALIGDGPLDILKRFDQLPPLPVPQPSTPASATVIISMLAGLKNWEQGLLSQAVPCFHAVQAVKLPEDQQWAAIYQSLAADYLHDYGFLSGPLFTHPPLGKAACESASRNLEALIPKLKTLGRAKFNVRAWQLDIARQAAINSASGTSGTTSEKHP